MRAAGVGKIVFSSSAAVYGTPDRLPVEEDASLRPENPYGSGNQMVEQILHWYHVSHGFDAVSLRYVDAAGASDDGQMGEDWTGAHNLVPRVMQALCGVSGPSPVFGTDFPTPDGTAVRDYVHAVERGGESVFNLGTGRGYSVRQVLAAAERASGRPVPHEDAPRRAGDPAAVWADVRAAAEVLDWRAERDLDDIMGTAWRWHSREGGDCQ
jgi:UDP-glucose 4-epimerase